MTPAQLDDALRHLEIALKNLTSEVAHLRLHPMCNGHCLICKENHD